MTQIQTLRREAHCTYRAMRRLLFGGEQKETAMPFPTSKCGRPGGRPVCARGRGAHRRRNKGLRGEKHHAGLEEGRLVPGGVVPVDEGTRVCGERSTTPNWRKAGSDPEPARSAAGWHQKAELLQQLRNIIILSDENRDLISENPSRIGLVWKIHEGILLGIMRNGSI